MIPAGGDNFPIFTGGIWVVGPAAAAAQQEVERAGVTLPLRWRDIHGVSMPMDQIRLRVSDLSCDAVMGAVSVLSLLVDWDTLADGEPAQFRAARLVLSPNLARRAIFHLGEGHRGVFVSHEQLLIAARLAVALGRSRPAEWATEWPRVGEVLLGINDLIGDARGDVEVPQGDDLLGMIVRGNVLRPEEPPVNRLARYRWLLSRDPNRVQGAPQLIRDNPPAALFQKTYGLSVEEFAICHLIYRHDFAELSKAGAPGNELFAFGRRGFRANIAEELHERFLTLSAATREALSAGFSTGLERPDLTSLSFLPFLARPVYRLSTGNAIPISHYLLHEQMGPGFYWLLRQAYAQGWDNAGRSAFGDYIGTLFQDYVDQLLQCAYATRSVGVYLTEQQVGRYDRRSGGRVAPADGFVVEDGRIGVIECWSAPLRPAALIGGGTAFRQEIQIDLMDKLQQLDRVIGDLESGALALPGGRPDGFRSYVPIVVLLHPFPQHPVILRAVLDEVSRRGLFMALPGGPGILPPQLVSADDLELLEPVLAAGGDALTHHLVRRDMQPETRGYSVRRYLQQRLGSVPANVAQQNLVKELTDLAGEHIETEGRRREQA
jgi:hypothetical protein